MKRILSLSYAAAIAAMPLLIFTSCYEKQIKDVEQTADFHVPGYVSEYGFLSEQREILRFYSEDLSDGTLSIMLPLRIERTVDVTDFLRSGDDSEYLALCRQFNDTSYDQHVVIWETGEVMCNRVSVLGEVITGIDIVSDEAWNVRYPAGSSLNTIFSVKFASVYPYVQGGYADYPLTLYDKPVSEIDAADMSMVVFSFSRYSSLFDWPDDDSGFMGLYTDVMPSVATAQTLTITLTTDSGKKIEYLVDVILDD